MDGCAALVHKHTHKHPGWGVKTFLTNWHNFDIYRPEKEFNFHTVHFVLLEEKLLKLVAQAKEYQVCCSR